MTKKNQKSKELEKMEIESAEAESEITESAEALSESKSSDPNPGEGTSVESLLDDVRHSLMEEEESSKAQKESKWWRRIGRSDKSAEPESSQETIEIDLPATSTAGDVLELQDQRAESAGYSEQIDDLINILEEEHQEPLAGLSTVAPTVEVTTEPEPEIDFEKLKEQAFRPRTPDEEPESPGDVRSIALGGDEDVFVEVESQVADPLEERINAFENALKPYKRYIYMALTLLGVGMAVVAALIIFNVLKQSSPEPVKEVSNLPYPTGVSLPGGWSFQLGRGTVENGKWDPGGAEWLEGTEVSRWVALPWNRQLEAVIRTLNPKDPIELVMSNNDKLTYEVYSIQEMSPEEMQALDSSTPSLLLILSQSDSEKRWVLTALP
jgi:hypothetical protein